MKKTIQINIAGVVFNIEEDAYNRLNNYLKSIQAYFSNYEDSQEIVNDIESRIAEKFLEKEKVDGQNVITSADVDSLMASMGTVADFEAMDEDGNYEAAARVSSDGNIAPSLPETAPTEGKKRLYRDTKRKALGGVMAGLANYLDADVTWLRIIYLLLTFGASPITDSGASGFFMLLYIACWIALPPNDHLVEDPRIKKFYRDPDNKVIGGVASGLAAYFGIDVAVIRLLFVLSVMLFGTGFIAYLVLWIVSPEANTLTQKMEMKGEPVTLENIETNIKRSLKIASDDSNENLLTRILLFPFRIFGYLLEGLGTLLKNLGPVLRVMIGLFLIVIGVILTFTVLGATGAFFGISNSQWANNLPTEAGMLTQDMSPWMGFFGFLATFIPALALIVLGISLLANRQVVSRSVWLTGLGVWLVGVFGTATTAASYMINFSREGTYKTTQTFELPSSMIYLTTDESSNVDWENQVDVQLETNSTNNLYLEKYFHAKGPSRQKAEENAERMQYYVGQLDSAVVFDRSFTLPKGSSFRKQRLEMRLAIPAGRRFQMSNKFANELLSDSWNLKRKYSIDYRDFEKYTFEMDNQDGIVCLDCPKLTEEEKEAVEQRNDDEDVIDSGAFEDFKVNGPSKTYDVEDFDQLDISNAFLVTVRQGSHYEVRAEAERESDLKEIEVKNNGGTLEIEFGDSFMTRHERIHIYIVMPELKQFQASGAVQAKVVGFDEVNSMEFAVSGASRIAADVEVNELRVDVAGASRMELRGKAENAEFEASGASHVTADRMIIENARADASGASKITFGQVKTLESETSGASKISRN